MAFTTINTHKKLGDYNWFSNISSVLMGCQDLMLSMENRRLTTKNGDTIDEMLVGGLRLVIN